MEEIETKTMSSDYSVDRQCASEADSHSFGLRRRRRSQVGVQRTTKEGRPAKRSPNKVPFRRNWERSQAAGASGTTQTQTPIRAQV
jgi:hypothetical protein